VTVVVLVLIFQNTLGVPKYRTLDEKQQLIKDLCYGSFLNKPNFNT